MCKLGEHPIVGPLLGQAFQAAKALLGAMACRAGVAPQDCDDVVQNAVLRIARYRPIADIAVLVSHWDNSPESIADLKAKLTALLVTHLPFAVGDYHRQQKADKRNRMDPRSVPGPVEDVMGVLISRLFPGGEVTMAMLSRGDEQASTRFRCQLFECARLDERERTLLGWRYEHPEKPDRLAFPDLQPPRITEIKQRAFRKMMRALRELLVHAGTSKGI